MQLKPYPEYKESGHPFLSKIPAHWDLFRNGRLFSQRNETGFGELPILEVSLKTGVRVRDMDNLKRKQVMADREKYKRAAQGDIAYNMMRMWQGAIGVAPIDGLVSPAYVVVRPFPEVDCRYFSYLFRTTAYMNEVDAYSRGIVKDRNRLYWQDFKRMPSVVPPIAEQRQIVRFLNDVGGKIHRFIRNKRRLIELLKEQKQNIINQAVTRGIDPNVKLKPSGVEWIKDIPEHWKLIALKRVLRRLVDCEHKTAPAVDRSEYVVVRTSAIRDGALKLSGTYCTTANAYKIWTQRGVPRPGDVIFTREAPAGEACVVPASPRLCLGQRTVLMKLRKNEYDACFLVNMINSGPPRTQISINSQGSTVAHFNMDDIGWMRVLRPPLSEQIEIVEHIKNNTIIIDKTITRAQCEIELIREYRTRLIGDVVTGQVDVRGIEVPEDAEEATYDEEDDILESSALLGENTDPEVEE